MYGVFKKKFCDDCGQLIYANDTEEIAEHWMTGHCIPGGLIFYTVEQLPEVKPSRVVREEDIELGYIWELENGLFVVLNVDGDEATLSLRMSKDDEWWLDEAVFSADTEGDGSYDWNFILLECEETMEHCGWILPREGIWFCVSEYSCKIDSKDNEIGGIDEQEHWFDTLDEAIASKERIMDSMKSELASHLSCAKVKEKGRVCVEAWVFDKRGERVGNAWEHLSDEEKEKLNQANEITDIWGRDL